jgi:hypothetical protein
MGVASLRPVSFIPESWRDTCAFWGEPIQSNPIQPRSLREPPKFLLCASRVTNARGSPGLPLDTGESPTHALVKPTMIVPENRRKWKSVRAPSMRKAVAKGHALENAPNR